MFLKLTNAAKEHKDKKIIIHSRYIVSVFPFKTEDSEEEITIVYSALKDRTALAQTEQEPVAWITRRTGDGGAYVDGYESCEPTDYGAFPVYHAPPKREWVGLTDGDLRQIILAAVGVAEAKLKEKNNG